MSQPPIITPEERALLLRMTSFTHGTTFLGHKHKDEDCILIDQARHNAPRRRRDITCPISYMTILLKEDEFTGDEIDNVIHFINSYVADTIVLNNPYLESMIYPKV